MASSLASELKEVLEVLKSSGVAVARVRTKTMDIEAHFSAEASPQAVPLAGFGPDVVDKDDPESVEAFFERERERLMEALS